MNGLVVSGWSETLNDGGRIWSLADAIETAIGHSVERRLWYTVTAADLAKADFVVCHSYGGAGVYHTLLTNPPDPACQIHLQKLFAIVPVPRAGFKDGAYEETYQNTFNWPANIDSVTEFVFSDEYADGPFHGPLSPCWVEDFPVAQLSRRLWGTDEHVNCLGDRQINADGSTGETFGHCSLPANPRVWAKIFAWLGSHVTAPAAVTAPPQP
jgi:hypothetical protein